MATISITISTSYNTNDTGSAKVEPSIELPKQPDKIMETLNNLVQRVDTLYQNFVIPEEMLHESIMNELYGSDEIEDHSDPKKFALESYKSRCTQIKKS